MNKPRIVFIPIFYKKKQKQHLEVVFVFFGLADLLSCFLSLYKNESIKFFRLNAFGFSFRLSLFFYYSRILMILSLPCVNYFHTNFAFLL